ncbi:hypothetical protein [Tenacibaculum sp. 190524A02b]|uniref:hypothetical protein n=1 Tax=Tenacibaculum vairaonense TaxID=3137860 RepID=UPI0031FB64FF
MSNNFLNVIVFIVSFTFINSIKCIAQNEVDSISIRKVLKKEKPTTLQPEREHRKKDYKSIRRKIVSDKIAAKKKRNEELMKIRKERTEQKRKRIALKKKLIKEKKALRKKKLEEARKKKLRKQKEKA